MKCKFFILYILVFFTACDLEEKPYTAGSGMTDVTDGALQMVNAVYNIFWSSELMKKSYMECLDMDHDHAAAPTWVMSGAGEGNMTNHWSYNTDSDPFVAFYRIINRANYALENLPQVPGLSEEELNQLTGEVYFLRAFAYFHLVRMYGGVPLRLTYVSDNDMPRATVEKVYERIILDLESACTMAWNTDNSKWGRTNKTAAKILLARVYATMGSAALAGKTEMDVNVKNTIKRYQTAAVAGFENVDAEACYKKVVELCDEVIAMRGVHYDLRLAFKDVWGSANFRNNEFVWGVAGNSQLDYTTVHLGYYYSAIPYNGRGWAGISEHAYRLYEEQDERGEHGIFHYIKQTFDNTAAYVRIPNNAAKYPTGPDGKPSRGVDNYYNIHYITKWHVGDVVNPQPSTQAPGYAYQAQDIILLRFVELYLLRAEALNELDKPELALTDLDVVRSRAKTSLLTGTTMDKVEIRSLILQERALEFMQEFNRKFDLLRWGLYLKVMNETSSVRVTGSVTISKVREPKCVLYAVPLNEINNNKLFGSNNSGW